MAVLRNGKLTNIQSNTVVKKRRNAKNPKLNDLLKQHRIKHCVVEINKINVNQLIVRSHEVTQFNDYCLNSLRPRINRDACLTVNKTIEKRNASKAKQIATKSYKNIIWNGISNREYTLGSGVIVFAKMNSYKPWPARINTLYKMTEINKCYVSFFGNFQIGSVLRSSCVPIGECDHYLLHAVREIKSRYKWNVDYDKIVNSDDRERARALLKLTQNQKFTLALRDIEHLNNIPYGQSVIQSN